MLKRIFPHPWLAVTLAVVWLALVNKITVGNLILGAVFGVAVTVMTAPYWPNRPKLGRPRMMVEYALIVLWDIVVANVQVAMIILFKRNAELRSQWVVVPLDLTSPEAITTLAGTITMTPGTVSATLSADARSLLVHALHTDDPDAVRETIKARYEWRLREIFQ